MCEIKEPIIFFMTTKYHTRQGYENLLEWLWRQRGYTEEYDFSIYGDYNLLRMINTELIFFGCVEFTIEELDMKLE